MRPPATLGTSSKQPFARRIRAARPRTRKYEIWDDTISGLGLCVGPSGHRVFVFRRMVAGRVRFATIGNADAISLPQARREARALIATWLDSPATGAGPRTPGRPMSEFADEFLERQARHWKPRTLETNKRAIRKEILPAFGHLSVDAITPELVRDWFVLSEFSCGVVAAIPWTVTLILERFLLNSALPPAIRSLSDVMQSG